MSEAGNTGQHTHPELEPGYLQHEPSHKLRAFRARSYDAHLSPEDVDDLWKLVQPGGPKHAAQAGYAGVIHGRPHWAHVAFRIPDHGAELDDVKFSSFPAKTPLPVEHRPPIEQKNQQGNECPQK